MKGRAGAGIGVDPASPVAVVDVQQRLDDGATRDDGATPDDHTARDDRTARARIRDAAIERFGAGGVDGTSLRAVAEAAGVSAALVVHHFGSKAGLRRACDEHVVRTIRDTKSQAMAAGPNLDVMAMLRDAPDARPLLAYLARTLAAPSPEVAQLVDDLVDDAEAYLAEGERSGVVVPTDDPRGRAVVLTIWALGALTLHEHLSRLLGAHLLTEPDGLAAYSRAATTILGTGVLDPALAARIVDAYRDLADPGATGAGASDLDVREGRP